MNQLETDIKNAINMIKHPDVNHNSMQQYSRIYTNTTENISSYMPLLIGNYNNALLTTSSGDHLLESLLYGIEDFTCFDINRLSKYFTELKFEAIRNLSKKEYLHFMYEDPLNKEYYNYFKISLDDDILTFWNELYKNCDIEDIKLNLFRHLGYIDNSRYIKGTEFSQYCAEKFITYLKEDNYKLIQDKLQIANIRYLEADLLKLPETLDEKYDYINLSNIYEFINKTIIGNGAIDFTNIIKKLISFLNDDGSLLITYLYKCSYEDIEKYRNKSILYAKLIALLINITSINIRYYQYAIRHEKRTLTDELYAYRNVQLLKYLKNLNIDMYELEETGLGLGLGNKDMILSYKKTKQL